MVPRGNAQLLVAERRREHVPRGRAEILLFPSSGDEARNLQKVIENGDRAHWSWLYFVLRADDARICKIIENGVTRSAQVPGARRRLAASHDGRPVARVVLGRLWRRTDLLPSGPRGRRDLRPRESNATRAWARLRNIPQTQRRSRRRVGVPRADPRRSVSADVRIRSRGGGRRDANASRLVRRPRWRPR